MNDRSTRAANPSAMIWLTAMHARSLTRFSGLSKGQIQRDLPAGLNVMTIAFPLSMAFAIASGVKPEVGLFGVVDKLDDELRRAKQEPDILILRVRKVLAIDATGLQALEDLLLKLRAKGRHLILSAPHTQPLAFMENAGFIDRIGRENVCPHIDAALARARKILGLPHVEPAIDPLDEERQKLATARVEITQALERANHVLQSPSLRGHATATVRSAAPPETKGRR